MLNIFRELGTYEDEFYLIGVLAACTSGSTKCVENYFFPGQLIHV